MDRANQLRSIVGHAERVVPWLALLAALVGLTLVARTQREAIAAVDWRISWSTLLVCVLAYSLPPLLQGISFWLVLRSLTGTTPLLDAMLVWSRSYVVRYAPTGALAIAYRITARRRLRATAEQVVSAYAYEHVGALAAGAAACLALFALAGDLPPLLPLGIASTVLLLTCALGPGLAGRAVSAVATRLGLELSAVLRGRHVAIVVAVNAVGWLGTGAAVYLLVASLTGDSPSVLWLLGSFAAGYLVGFVAPLAPGGLGVREGTLVVLFATRYGTGAALGLALAIRALNVAGELVAVGLVHTAAGVSRLRAVRVSAPELRAQPRGS